MNISISLIRWPPSYSTVLCCAVCATQRSQPPLLSETLRAVYEDHKRQEQQQQHPRQQERQLGQQQQQQPEEEGGGASSAMMDLVREALPLLVQEHTFWTSGMPPPTIKASTVLYGVACLLATGTATVHKCMRGTAHMTVSMWQ